MGLEAATYINGLIATNPTGTDGQSQGDDHLRLIKTTLLNTFPNISGAVTPTEAELNVLTGGLVKSDVGLGNVDNTSDADKPVSTAQQAALDLKADQTDVDLKAPISSPLFTGNPRAPTPAGGDNDTSIATTAFVQAAVAGLSPIADGINGNGIKYVTSGSNAVNVALSAGTWMVMAWYRYYDDNYPNIALVIDGVTVDNTGSLGDPTGTSFIFAMGVRGGISGNRTISVSATAAGSSRRIMALAIRTA